MAILDKLLKLNYIEVNVYTQIGKESYKLQKTVYVPWDKNGDSITVDGNTYIIDHNCLIFKDRVVSFGPWNLLTIGNTASIDIQKGNMSPLTLRTDLHRDAKAFEEHLRSLAQINMLRNKEADKWRKQYMYLFVIFAIGLIGALIVLNFGNIMNALRPPATNTGGGMIRAIFNWVKGAI
jgi:hypothetical protein